MPWCKFLFHARDQGSNGQSIAFNVLPCTQPVKVVSLVCPGMLEIDGLAKTPQNTLRRKLPAIRPNSPMGFVFSALSGFVQHKSEPGFRIGPLPEVAPAKGRAQSITLGYPFAPVPHPRPAGMPRLPREYQRTTVCQFLRFVIFPFLQYNRLRARP